MSTEYYDEGEEEERKPGNIAFKKSNILPLWGNERTMNLNPLILTNIQSSHYFKVNLYELKTYHEVIDEIYYKVAHLEPWEKGSRKTSGQTGMCGGVRGVGAGGIVSTAYCLLYKLFTLKLTRKQLNGLITHPDSPYIRALGFMYIRYTQPPADLWDWYDEYLEDPEELDVKAGGGQVMTMGNLLKSFLSKLEWFSTLFPRIPVPIQQKLEKNLGNRFAHIKQPPVQPVKSSRLSPVQDTKSRNRSRSREGIRDSYLRDSRRDSRERDARRESREREFHKDSRDKEFRRESRDREYLKDSRDREYLKDSRDKDYLKDNRDRDYLKDSRDREFRRDSRDREFRRDSRDKEFRRDSRDKEFRRDSRDREYRRDSRDRDFRRDSRERDIRRDSREKWESREKRDFYDRRDSKESRQDSRDRRDSRDRYDSRDRRDDRYSKDKVARPVVDSSRSHRDRERDRERRRSPIRSRESDYRKPREISRERHHRHHRH